MAKLDRFGAVSAGNLIESIQARRQPPLDRFIFGLGIRYVGSKTATDLAKHFSTIDDFTNATIDQLEAVPGVGKIVAESIMGWLSDEDNIQLLRKFAEYGVQPKPIQVGGKLAGQSFVITGTLTSMSRDEAANKIKELGGEFQGSVGKSTTYLVMGEKAGNSKRVKAEKLGTKVIDEAELLKMLAN